MPKATGVNLHCFNSSAAADILKAIESKQNSNEKNDKADTGNEPQQGLYC